jgi:hypothetical protein
MNALPSRGPELEEAIRKARLALYEQRAKAKLCLFTGQPVAPDADRQRGRAYCMHCGKWKKINPFRPFRGWRRIWIHQDIAMECPKCRRAWNEVHGSYQARGGMGSVSDPESVVAKRCPKKEAARRKALRMRKAAQS